jgi:large repetitive protein
VPNTHTLDSVANKVFLFLSALLAAIALAVPAVAFAAGEPNISLDKHAPEQALLGTTQPVQLVVKNPVGQPRGYNLSFRDVLPKGVTYVANSSSKIPPTVLLNAPHVGETTLLFENVSDLSAGSEYVLAYEVEPSTTFFKLAETHIYTNKAEAFVTKEPRNKPNFAANGEVVAGSFKGNDGAEATTELTAIEIEKSEPSPEGEILRGVHEHQTVYTLTVKNNKVGPTQGTELRLGKPDAIGIEDFLPAGLEFLGCGTTDNTTNAVGTNSGSAEEYPGSGAIDPGNAPSVPNCIAPYYVKTEEVDPPGPKPLGIYTHVKWEGPESLAKGEEYKLEYVAAIPILRNSLTWSGAEPSAEGLGQIADLNNNQGPETFDEEELTNIARATGEYEKVDVQDSDEMTRTAEDLAIQKTVNQEKIFDNARSVWSLNLETSEYRWDEPVSITDELPNGLCPLGTKDFEGPSGSPSPECQPTEPTKFHPVVKYVKGGAKPAGTEEQVAYSLAEEHSTGGYELAFDDSTVSALEHLEPSQELLITFPTATQTFYQLNFEDDKAKPVLTGDSWTNSVETKAEAFNRCYTGEGAAAVADPNCEVPGASRIFPHIETGIPVTDVSAASQEAGGVEIEKTVRKNEGLVPAKCAGEATEYVKGLEGFPGGLPLYRPGDEICWRLVVKFAANLYAGHPVVSDFIPTDEEYVKGSAVEGENNTIHSTFNEVAAETEEALEWEVGKAGSDSVEKEQLFEWRFKTKVKATPSSEPGEISGNLMKFVYSNTEGETFPLRDRAEVKRTEPALTLTKRVLEVNGAPAGEGATVRGGDEVKYGIEIPNTKGTLKAEEIEVWDELPPEFECGVNIKKASISNAGECAGTGRIVWKGVEVGPGATAGPLTYVVKVPIEVAPGHKFENEAGVTQFKSETNTGEKFTYFPENNINPAVTPEEENAGPARDTASVVTTGAALTKTAKAENGKNEATIGEIVHYTVVATIPAGSTLYGAPAITDTVPGNLEYIAGSATSELSAGAGGTIKSTVVTGALITVDLEAPYVNPEGSGADVVTIKFEARVKDLAANVRGTEITNHALFKFEDNPVAGRVVELPAEATTPVVEPNLIVGKSQSTAPTGIVAPGDVVEYTVTATDSKAVSNVSPAYEVQLTDTIPIGMELVKGSISGGGTAVGRTISWVIPVINPGETVPRTYQLKVEEPAPAASTFPNTVTGTTQTLPFEGGKLPPETRISTFEEGGYKASAGGYESKAETSVRLIGATVSKTVTPGEGTIGSEMTYTLHMNLPAEIEFANTTLVDQLPKGMTFREPIGTPECEITSGPTKGQSCGTGTELTSEPGPEGTTLLGWYFAEYAAIPATRELTVEIKAIVNKEATAAELKNKLAGFYNEPGGAKPAQLPVPGTESTLFKEETNVAEVPFKVFQPKLKLTKAVSGGVGTEGKTAVPGGPLSYTLTVKNEGAWPAYDFNVKDHPSANLTGFVLGAVENEGTGTVTPTSTAPPAWHVEGPLPAGKVLKLHYTAKLVESNELANGEAIENEAEVPTYFGLKPSERVPPFVEEYPALQAKQQLQVELPQITLVKTTGTPGHAEGAEADVGVGFPWRIVVGNTAANAAAKEAVIVDTLPQKWHYVPNSATVNGTKVEPTEAAGEPVKLTWTLPSLPANNAESTEILFEAVPSVGAAAVKNEAVVTAKDESGSSGPEGAEYEAEGSATATIVAPKFKVEKTPDGDPAIAGTEREYSIKVTNIGTGKASAPIKVEDQLGPEQKYLAPEASELPAGVTQVSVNPTTGIGPAQIIWSIASLEVGASVTIQVPISIPSEVDNGQTISDIAKVSSSQAPTVEEDPGSFLVEREADLVMEKSASSVEAGENIVYALTATNVGPSNASEVVIEDEVPAGTTYVRAVPKPGSGTTGSCAVAGSAVICNVFGEIAPGGKVEFEAEFLVESGREESLTNKAEVTAKERDPEPLNNKKEITTPIGGLASLAIEKIGPELPVLLGSEFTYEIKVENKGPSDAVNAVVEDQLPAQVKFVSATTSLGECDEAPAALLTCELGRMLPLTKGTIVVKVEAAEVGAFTNVATFDSETSPEPKVGEAPAEILPAADLAITKTAPATVEPNGEVTYKLQVEDRGPSTAHKVVVTDPLPAGTEFVKASEGCSAAGTVVTCEVAGGELEVGKVADFQITVHVPYALGGAPLSNTASVTAEEGDPHPEDNSSTVTTTVGPDADLAITKTMGKAEAGKPLVYTLAITNHGPSASSAVTVKDTLPAGTTFKSAAPSQGSCSASGQSVTCQLGALASGGSAQVSITVEVAATATGNIRNVASVEGPEPDPDKSNNESAVEGPVTPAPAGGTPNLKVVKTADTSTPQVGVPFQYDVAISNSGDADAKNVKVVDTLSGPVKVVSIDAGPGKCTAAGSKIECTIPSVAVGKTVHVTYSVVAESTGALSNTASAMAANGEKAPANNHAVKGVKAIAAKANFTLAKVASRPVVPGGQKVGFTITLHNGATALTEAKVCDRLPAALVFVKAAGAAFVNGEACWKEHYVAPHKVLRLHLMARAVKGFTARRAKNVASASAANAKGARKASATVRIKPVFGGAPGGVTG